MTTLERRYRWLLSLYPSSYREQRGDEIIATLLDAAQPEQQWPTLSESVSLAWQASSRRVFEQTSWSYAAAISDGFAWGGVVAFALAVYSLPGLIVALVNDPVSVGRELTPLVVGTLYLLVFPLARIAWQRRAL